MFLLKEFWTFKGLLNLSIIPWTYLKKTYQMASGKLSCKENI